jgi:hypothetical protein
VSSTPPPSHMDGAPAKGRSPEDGTSSGCEFSNVMGSSASCAATRPTSLTTTCRQHGVESSEIGRIFVQCANPVTSKRPRMKAVSVSYKTLDGQARQVEIVRFLTRWRPM